MAFLPSPLARLRSIWNPALHSYRLNAPAIALNLVPHPSEEKFEIRSYAVPTLSPQSTPRCALSSHAVDLTSEEPSRLDQVASTTLRRLSGLPATVSHPLAGMTTRLRSSHGVWCTYSALNLEQRPPTLTQAPVLLAETSTSRLRYVFRLSQPLDVLFRSKPSQPCFMLVALMGFGLRSLPLAGSCTVVTRQRAGTSPRPSRLPIFAR